MDKTFKTEITTIMREKGFVSELTYLLEGPPPHGQYGLISAEGKPTTAGIAISIQIAVAFLNCVVSHAIEQNYGGMTKDETYNFVHGLLDEQRHEVEAKVSTEEVKPPINN